MQYRSAEEARLWNPKAPVGVGRRVTAKSCYPFSGPMAMQVRAPSKTSCVQPSEPAWKELPEQVRSRAWSNNGPLSSYALPPPARTTPTDRSFGLVCQLWDVDETCTANNMWGRYNPYGDQAPSEMGKGWEFRPALERYKAALLSRTAPPKRVQSVQSGTSKASPAIAPLVTSAPAVAELRPELGVAMHTPPPTRLKAPPRGPTHGLQSEDLSWVTGFRGNPMRARQANSAASMTMSELSC